MPWREVVEYFRAEIWLALGAIWTWLARIFTSDGLAVYQHALAIGTSTLFFLAALLRVIQLYRQLRGKPTVELDVISGR